jgi:predicted permease
VGGQVALCVIVLAVASLLSRSFVRSRSVDPGLNAKGVLDVQLDAGQRRAEADGLILYDRLTERLAAVPGVSDVALADIAPLAGSNMETRVAVDGMTSTDRASMPRTYFNVVGARYFTTVQMRLVRGREFTRMDGPASPKVAVINETAARRWWPDVDPIGRYFRWGGADGDRIEVVGVARDAKYNSYGEDPTPFVYLPFAQHYRSQMIAHVRVARASVTPAMLVNAVRETDPVLPPPAVKPLAEEIGFALLPARLGATLLGAFGAVALLIAASGIYGVTSYVVSRRTKEIGIRSALGAPRSRLLSLIIGEGMRTVGIGSAIGLVLAMAVGTLLSRVLYGISPIDPTMLLGVPAVLASVALLACWVPARRAARVDPVTAMRAE